MTTVAVIGCTHAGTFATTSILAEHPDWTVHVFERNGTLSFLSCGIALWVGDHVSDPKKMFYSSPAALAEAGATMHMRTDVTSVDLDARTLTYRALDEAGDPAEQTLAFDKLVVTTGSRPVIPPIPGIDSPHVLLCKNWDHAIAIKEKAKTAKSAVVIGSGYIGAEIAEQFSVTGVKTTLVDGLDRPLANNFDKTITDQVAAAFEEHGVTLALGQKVVEFRDNDDDTVTVVMINYYMAEVTKVKDGEVTVRVLSDKAKTNPIDERTITADGFAEDDYVVVTVDVDEDGDAFVATINDPATAEGTVTRVKKDADPEEDQGNYVKLDDGNKYTYSKYTASDLDDINEVHPTLDIAYRLYLDPNGYVIGFLAMDDYYANYLYVDAVDVSLKTITLSLIHI